MKVLLSPAKSLDFESTLPTSEYTTPLFPDEAEKLNAKLERKSKKAIKSLMGISENLANLNYQRYKEFETPFTKENSRPAVYVFNGDVYQGLDAYTIPESKIAYMQETVRILSGMYGMLRPLDLIQPYRLEMGTSLQVNRKKNLYEFWGNSITEALNETLKEGELVVNLASQEYSKVVDFSKLKGNVISPVFKDFKNGKLMFISFFAKKARGSMARYIIDHKVDNEAQLLGFDYDGYRFSETETKDRAEPVFIR